MNGIATQNDVLAIEAQGVPPNLPASTYEMICAGAAIDPSAPALSFFLTADAHRDAERWTYRELVRDITRTANLFTRLGVENSVIAYVLPNLPETHFVIWGGQAAGIVCAINPLLEGEAIGKLLKAAGASVLVTLAPFPGPISGKSREYPPRRRVATASRAGQSGRSRAGRGTVCGPGAPS